MEKEIWKWALDHLFDEEMINLTRLAKVRPDGFREVNVKNIKMVRPKLIQTFLQKRSLNKLKLTINQMGKKGDLIDYRSQPKQELLNLIVKDFLCIVPILLSLLSSTHSKEYQQGIHLYYELKEKGYLKACEQQITLIKSQKEKLKQMSLQMDELTQRNTDLQKNNLMFLETIEKNKQEQIKYKLQTQQLQKEKALLKRELSEMIHFLKQTTPQICIIGKIHQDLLSYIENQQYIKVIENTDDISIENLIAYYQVWILSYDIPFTTRRKISLHLPQTKVRQFHSYLEMKEQLQTFMKGCP